VSTREQLEGYSIDAQLRVCREWIIQQGHSPAGEYIEAASGESVKKRETLKEALEDAKSKGYDLLVVHKLDRLSRNLDDTLGILSQLKEAGVAVASATEPIDFSSTFGKALLVLIVLFAEIFLANLGREIRKGNLEKARQGLWHGRVAPMGYRVVDNRLVPRPEERKVVERAFELAASGRYSLGEISLILKSEGLKRAGGKSKGEVLDKNVPKDILSKMLHNPVYKGQVVIALWADRKKPKHERDVQTFKGIHEPLVTEERYDSVQKILRGRHNSGRGVHRTKTNNVFGNGMLKCSHCGGSLITSLGSRGYISYRCKSRWQFADACDAKHTLISEGKMSAEFQKIADRISLPRNWEAELERMGSGKRVDIYAARREKLMKMRANAYSAFLAADMDEDEWNRRKAAIDKELSELPVIPIGVQQVRQAAKIVPAFSRTWKAATPEEKRQLIRMMFIRITVDLDDGRICEYEPTPSFVPLLGGEKVSLPKAL
jgi:site-specific DNA recombinase